MSADCSIQDHWYSDAEASGDLVSLVSIVREGSARGEQTMIGIASRHVRPTAIMEEAVSQVPRLTKSVAHYSSVSICLTARDRRRRNSRMPSMSKESMFVVLEVLAPCLC